MWTSEPVAMIAVQGVDPAGGVARIDYPVVYWKGDPTGIVPANAEQGDLLLIPKLEE